MKILHRISENVNKNQLEQLRRLGIEPALTGDLASFTIAESDTQWPAVKRLTADWKPVDIAWTEFTASELGEARLLQMSSTGFHGYPQPEDDFGYVPLCYDVSNYCKSCGIGAVQRAPFRMRQEPNWGTRQILQMNWLFDEFFVRPQTWAEVFRDFGVGTKPVIHHKTGAPLTTVVQLSVTEHAISRIRVEGLPSETCPKCNRMKLHPITRGLFPHVEIPEHVHMAKTREYFGSGGSAWQATLISAPLYAAVEKHRVKAVAFAVVG